MNKSAFLIPLFSMALASPLAYSESLFVGANGFVGVGTGTPDKLFHIKGPIAGPEALFKLEHADATKVRFAYANANGAMTFDMSPDATKFIIQKVGGIEMMTVTDTGQLFIGGVLAFDASAP